MNVKYIFLFIMFVVLPNVMYSNYTTPAGKQQNVRKLAKTWRKMFELYNPIQADKIGIVFMKILVIPGAQKNAIFVPEYDRIGVNITAPIFDKKEANEEVIDYLAKVLGLSKGDLKLVSGFSRETKTFKLAQGILSVKRVKEKLIQKLLEQKHQ